MGRAATSTLRRGRRSVVARQRTIVALATIARFATGVLMGTAMAVYVGRIGTPFAVSLVFLSYSLGMLVFAPVWGALADVTGNRLGIMLATGALATVSVLPLLVVEGVWLPIGLRLLYSIFAVGYIPLMLAIASERGGDEGRGRSIGFFQSVRAAGITGGQFLAGVLLGLVSPADLYFAVFVASLAATVLVLVIEDPDERPTRRFDAREFAAEVRRRLLPTAGGDAVLRANGLRWLYVAVALRYATLTGVMSLMPVYLLVEVGTSEFLMGMLLAFPAAASVILMYAFGRLADGVRRTPLILFGLAGTGAMALVVAGASVPADATGRVAVVAFAFVVQALTVSSLEAGATAFIGDVAPVERLSELMGLRSTAIGVGGIVGPPAIGALATASSYEVAFVVASAFAFVATTLVHRRVSDPGSSSAPAPTPPCDPAR